MRKPWPSHARRYLRPRPSANVPERVNVADDDNDEVNLTHVKAIMRDLQREPRWQQKVADATTARRFAQAARQGASDASVAVALRELLAEVVAGSEGFSSILSLPPVVFDKHGNQRTYSSDPDYYVSEDQEDEWEERVEVVGRKSKDEPEEAREWRLARRDHVHEVEDRLLTKLRESSGVWYVDGAVPEELQAILETALDAIADAPDKDFHPGSDGKVQDLIHPSLYPYIRGCSYEPNGRRQLEANNEESEGEDIGSEEDEDERDRIEDAGGYPDKEKDYDEEAKKLEGLDSIYQWLPAEFDVALDGEVSIASYINNLDHEEHPHLYDTIANVFRLFLPLFEQVVDLERLYDHRLQVIVKAANYILAPGQEHEGSWHVEGMKHEHIVASGIYYYSTTPNLPNTCLAFRDRRANSFYDRQQTHNLGFSINLGKVDTPAGRCLVFANNLQHRVKSMVNESDKVGVRKILCFFLVNPEVRIKSSADVPWQQWDKIRPGVARVLVEAMVWHKVLLPPEIVEYIVKLAKWGFTKEEAETHREALMKERKYYIDANNRQWQRDFSFCEH